MKVRVEMANGPVTQCILWGVEVIVLRVFEGAWWSWRPTRKCCFFSADIAAEIVLLKRVIFCVMTQAQFEHNSTGQVSSLNFKGMRLEVYF